jgi:hypothetical protein
MSGSVSVLKKLGVTDSEAAAIPKFSKVNELYKGRTGISRFELNVESLHETRLTFSASRMDERDSGWCPVAHYVITLIPTFERIQSELLIFSMSANLQKLTSQGFMEIAHLELDLNTTQAIIVEQKEPKPSMKKIFSLAVQEIIQGTADKLVDGNFPRNTEHLLLSATVIDLLHLKDRIVNTTSLLRAEVIKMATNTIEQPRSKNIITNSSDSMSLVTALRRCEGIKTPRNLEVDAHLKEGGRLYGSWVLGTGVVHEKPGEKFRNEVKIDDFTFEVPQRFRGLKDSALVFQSGFKIDQRTGLYTGEVTNVVEQFPAPDGWYKVHPETGIPQGKEVSSDDQEARYLYRRNTGGYVGAVVRGDVGCGGWRDLYVCGWPGDDGFRVALYS